jgi:hypothetical protein
LIRPALADLYRQKVADLQSNLSDPAQAPEAFELIRSLVEVVVLTPENGKLEVELRGELAGILALCSDAKKPAGRIAKRASLEVQVCWLRGHATNEICCCVPPLHDVSDEDTHGIRFAARYALNHHLLTQRLADMAKAQGPFRN